MIIFLKIQEKYKLKKIKLIPEMVTQKKKTMQGYINHLNSTNTP